MYVLLFLFGTSLLFHVQFSLLLPDLDNVLKSRDITFLTKICIVKALVFPVAMYGSQSLTINKAGQQRTDAFKLWY